MDRQEAVTYTWCIAIGIFIAVAPGADTQPQDRPAQAQFARSVDLAHAATESGTEEALRAAIDAFAVTEQIADATNDPPMAQEAKWRKATLWQYLGYVDRAVSELDSIEMAHASPNLIQRAALSRVQLNIRRGDLHTCETALVRLEDTASESVRLAAAALKQQLADIASSWQLARDAIALIGTNPQKAKLKADSAIKIWSINPLATKNEASFSSSEYGTMSSSRTSACLHLAMRRIG